MVSNFYHPTLHAVGWLVLTFSQDHDFATMMDSYYFIIFFHLKNVLEQVQEKITDICFYDIFCKWQ